jgi:CRP/FNR family transcriptional regulator, cyclic AMP receptor protein
MNSTTIKTSSTPTNINQPLDTLIAEHPFLAGLSAEHIKILIECAMFSEFKEDQWIFSEGDPANRFYLILDGEIALESHVQDGRTVSIETIGEGDVLGWSWLFPSYHWHFDARALKDTKAIFFYGTRLREYCEEDHTLGYELMKRTAKVLIKRLEAMRRQLLAASGVLSADD